MMNKQQQQTTHSSIFGQSGINRKPQCLSQNQATLICLNPNCQVVSFRPTKNKIQQKEIPLENQLLQGLKSPNIRKTTPFICTTSDCQSCYPIQQKESSFWSQNKNMSKNVSSHAKCFKGDFQSLLVCIEQKKKESLPLKSCITQIFDNFIDYLSELRDKYLNQLNYYGLSQTEKSYLSCIENGKYDEITSKLCFNVVKDLDHQAQVNSQMAKQKLKEYWQIEEKKIRKSIEFIEKIVNKQFTSSGPNTQIDSQIITQLRQKQILIQMLESQTQQKNVQSFNLLYRASQNQFSTEAFHNKCDNVNNTLLVMQTEFGKKIGGYTPLKWDKALNNRTEKDPSNNTFIFSLTNNHKFSLKQGSEAAILQYSSAGPTFGTGPSDIYVKNKANSTSMYGNIGNTFVHPEYTFGDQRSWTKFSGATNGKQFKAKEWQIFEVKWWQKD